MKLSFGMRTLLFCTFLILSIAFGYLGGMALSVDLLAIIQFVFAVPPLVGAEGILYGLWLFFGIIIFVFSMVGSMKSINE